MGGYGSGRSGAGKTRVESCRSIDINRLVQEGVVRPGHSSRGGWKWTQDGEEVSSLGYEVETQAEAGTLRLRYRVMSAEGEGASQDYKIALVTTLLVSGGRRWWFLCPACRNGTPPCRRRVGKLYLPPGGRIFACRRCYDLAYESSRKSYHSSKLWDSIGAAAGLSGRDAQRLMNWAFRQDR
jgi:hypothetical protein